MLIIIILTCMSMIGIKNYKKEKQEVKIENRQKEKERNEIIKKENNTKSMLIKAKEGLLTEDMVDKAVENDDINKEDSENIKEAIIEYKKIEAEKEEKKEQEKAEKEKENTDASYETGITYDNLARNPETYKNIKVNLTGKITQVLEGEYTTTIRLAVNNDYDKVVIAKIDSKLLYNNRLLENDIVNIKGVSSGMMKYENALGIRVSAPEVAVDRFKIQD